MIGINRVKKKQFHHITATSMRRKENLKKVEEKAILTAELCYVA